MKYKVLTAFTDVGHGLHVYNVGDEYPAKGRPAPSPDRVAYLMNEADKPNSFNACLLEEIKPKAPTRRTGAKRDANTGNDLL